MVAEIHTLTAYESKRNAYEWGSNSLNIWAEFDGRKTSFGQHTKIPTESGDPLLVMMIMCATSRSGDCSHVNRGSTLGIWEERQATQRVRRV